VGPAAALGALRNHRSLLIGGGGLFGSGMGRLGRMTALFGLAASALGRRVAVVGVGVDPDLPLATAWPLRRLAPRLETFTVRDRASADALGEIGIAATVVDDLSAAMEPAPVQDGRALLRAAGLDLRRPIVGLSLTALHEHAQAGTEPSLIRAIGALADAVPDIGLCLIPMSQHPFVAAHNDVLLARRLQAAVPQLRVLEGLHHPSRILAAFGQLSVVVAMRYHALLFADRMNVPLVPVPYAAKCRAWVADHGMTAVPVTGEDLTDAVRSGIDQRLARSA
jgi:polysaccharide pyruvyl transferase WcaK-like protein